MRVLSRLILVGTVSRESRVRKGGGRERGLGGGFSISLACSVTCGSSENTSLVPNTKHTVRPKTMFRWIFLDLLFDFAPCCRTDRLVMYSTGLAIATALVLGYKYWLGTQIGHDEKYKHLGYKQMHSTQHAPRQQVQVGRLHPGRLRHALREQQVSQELFLRSVLDRCLFSPLDRLAGDDSIREIPLPEKQNTFKSTKKGYSTGKQR